MIFKDPSSQVLRYLPFTLLFQIACMLQTSELTGERESNISALETLRDQHERNHYPDIHFKDLLLVQL